MYYYGYGGNQGGFGGNACCPPPYPVNPCCNQGGFGGVGSGGVGWFAIILVIFLLLFLCGFCRSDCR